jgi:hypothetical protein
MKSLPPSFFKLNSVRTRAAICGAGIASFYGWLEYSTPGTLTGLDITRLLANPFDPILIIPPIIAAGAMILPAGLQKLGGLAHNVKLPKGKKAKGAEGSADQQYGSSTQQASAGGQTASVQQPAPPATTAPPPPPPIPVQFDDAKLVEVIKNKTSYMVDEIDSVKKEFSSVRGDIDGLKGEIKELTSTFESSLVELKAFQAEMVNPINFMRKYFELLDIKSVSDPANPMKPIGQVMNNVSEIQNAAAAAQAQAADNRQSEPAPTAKSEFHQPPSVKSAASELEDEYLALKKGEGMSRQDRRTSGVPSLPPRLSADRISDKILSKKILDTGAGPEDFIKTSLRSGLTPGRIMSIVSIVDEILAAMGPDGIELVLEQYRALGLRQEEERLIYGVVRMLNESKLLTDDIIAILYRFGQVLGINDEDAELQYMKTIANKRNAERRTPDFHREGTSSTGSAE